MNMQTVLTLLSRRLYWELVSTRESIATGGFSEKVVVNMDPRLENSYIDRALLPGMSCRVPWILIHKRENIIVSRLRGVNHP